MSKERIIAEIKRTAENNGGVPLGKQRFFKETGIKEADWAGKYWSKWGDAVIEAGYKPNERQSSLPVEELLEKLSLLVIELGHMPTRNELKMKARIDETFPSHNTFNKFGSKKELVGHLLEYAKSSNCSKQIIDILKDEPHIAPSESENVDSQDAAATKEGWVYLIQFGQEYKIGSSNSVERRFRELRTQMPYDGEIIHTIATGDPEGIEAYWHQYFAEKRLKGEWFKLTASDVRYFKRRKLM